MRKRYCVIRIEIGAPNHQEIIEEITSFEHHDISSNSFLRAWTAPSWSHHFETAKQRKLDVKVEPRFSEHVTFDGIDNFCAPLTLVVIEPTDNTMRIIRYFVIEALKE